MHHACGISVKFGEIVRLREIFSFRENLTKISRKQKISAKRYFVKFRNFLSKIIIVAAADEKKYNTAEHNYIILADPSFCEKLSNKSRKTAIKTLTKANSLLISIH
jgi:hypothetical protein